MATRIKDKFEEWSKECDERFFKMKANEEELNRIFIDIYGLGGELDPEVQKKDITVRRADKEREVRSLISYAAGCIFGRYSLDEQGLVYAGGVWDPQRYKTIVPDADNILPVCPFFENDLCGGVVKFIETVYGKETLEENLEFIAEALGGKGSPRDILRNYLMSGFYADHVKIYRKRPVYWLFSSGKKRAFRAYVYIHRYSPDLLLKMLNGYVKRLYGYYADMPDTAKNSAVKIKSMQAELKEYEEKLACLASQHIQIDLDDGVKTNYQKFAALLEKTDI